MKIYLALLITIIFSVAAQQADAHKIRVFAYAEGEKIVGETAFSGGRLPKNVEIRLSRVSDNTILATTSTDESGKFSLPIPEVAREQNASLLVTVDSRDGHINSWLLEPADYIAGFQKSASPAPAKVVQVTSQPGDQETSCTSIDPAQLQTMIDESIASQLSPIKQLLVRTSEQKLSLQDILGGVGYIIGLAGLAAYLQSKKGEK